MPPIIQDPVETAIERKRFWQDKSNQWRTRYYVTGLLATLLTTAATVVNGFDLESIKLLSKIFSGAATIILAVTAFLGPLKQVNQKMKAYMILDNALNVFAIDGDKNKVSEAIKAAELAANEN